MIVAFSRQLLIKKTKGDKDAGYTTILNAGDGSTWFSGNE